MMRIERHHDPAEFFALVAPFLELREAEHNLQLGFRQRLEADRHAFGSGDPLLYAVLDDGNVTAVATQTPPFGLVLSEVDDAQAVEALADQLAADGAQLPTAMGPVEAARTFAERWAQIAGVLPSVQTAERIYEATAVMHPQGVSGAMRSYTGSDRALAIDWMGAFFEEALPGSPEAIPNGSSRVEPPGSAHSSSGRTTAGRYRSQVTRARLRTAHASGLCTRRRSCEAMGMRRR